MRPAKNTEKTLKMFFGYILLPSDSKFNLMAKLATNTTEVQLQCSLVVKITDNILLMKYLVSAKLSNDHLILEPNNHRCYPIFDVH